jgi:perosamine synthetase
MKNKEFIPIYSPFIAKNQKKYVLDCLDTNWISSRGNYIDLFEKAISDVVGVKEVIAVFNGSVSLMLILSGLGIGYGDEVITQSLTYAATVSSIQNVGATPVLIDSTDSFQMDISLVERTITKKTKAVMVAQLYGDSPNMERLVKICRKNSIHLIEDSAECFGCYSKSSAGNKALGSFGIANSFSFFGNKVITTGEGGCVCTNDINLARRLRMLRSQSHIGGFRHAGPGFNFRMTNIQAAIGVAQLEHLKDVILKKKKIANYYRKNLHPSIRRIVPSVDSSEWLPLFSLPDSKNYLKFHTRLHEEGIDLRPAFPPIHGMKGFKVRIGSKMDTCTRIYSKAFNLPSGPGLTAEQLKRIVNTVNIIIEEVD